MIVVITLVWKGLAPARLSVCVIHSSCKVRVWAQHSCVALP